jgi:hypothetical protein
MAITWSERPLREGLERLSHEAGIAIFLDRRIDPGQSLTLQVLESPLESLVKAIANKVDADTVQIGAIIYFGPAETVRELATLVSLRRQEVAKLPAARQERLLVT